MTLASEKAVPAGQSAHSLEEAIRRKGQFQIFGLDKDQIIRAFFAGNASLAIVVLFLIMIFLFKEGIEFFNLGFLKYFGLKPGTHSVSSFLFGTQWVTGTDSEETDIFGVVPLFAGSLMISLVALVVAVPFGVGSAIYVAEVAGRTEREIIKPIIEFIAAIPSVVLGFFGVAVLGNFLQSITHSQERLNILNAGLLLAFMAIPTIFTLSEDALKNVPEAFRQASYALGANRWQTLYKIQIPAALSGIVSAILLGLGRVIGETMVVLAVAGNVIMIPDFSKGVGVVLQPVHTMTGIIAQEMGEVPFGSVHYRALFCVGILLFLITLLLNYLAQLIVKKFKISGV